MKVNSLEDLKDFYFEFGDHIWFKYNTQMAAPLENVLEFTFPGFSEFKVDMMDEINTGEMDPATSTRDIMDYLI